MFFHLRDLELKKVPFEVEFPAGEIDFEISSLRQVGPLRSQGVAELESVSLSEIRIRGSVQAVLEGECDRCLETIQFHVNEEFDLHYRPQTQDDVPPEMEIHASEAEIAFYDGVGIELKEVLREFVFLSLPMRLVCQESCRGLCGKCGVNLNSSSCDCVQEEQNEKWAALRDWKVAFKTIAEEKN